MGFINFFSVIQPWQSLVAPALCGARLMRTPTKEGLGDKNDVKMMLSVAGKGEFANLSFNYPVFMFPECLFAFHNTATIVP